MKLVKLVPCFDEDITRRVELYIAITLHDMAFDSEEIDRDGCVGFELYFSRVFKSALRLFDC